jgi:hypothetical protein
MSDSDRRENPGAVAVTRRQFAAGAVAGAASGLGLGFCQEARVASAAAAAAAAAAKDEDLGRIPRRLLGKTGVEVSILGLGTAPMGEGPQKTPELVGVFSEAIDRGITYVDTARIYGDAEEALAEVLKARRDRVFLVTKCMEDTREAGQRSFETSLRTLGVDHVDLLHLHSTGDRDLDEVLKPGGLWDYLLGQKKAGKTRFLGITGHNRPQKFARMLETGQVDAMMVAMNFVDRHVYGFEDKVLPLARQKGVGVMAMKTFGGILGGFRYNRQVRPSQMDAVYLQNAVRYSLSLEGVTGIVVGVHSAEEMRQNIRFVLNATPLSEKERESMAEHGKRLAEVWGARFGPAA